MDHSLTLLLLCTVFLHSYCQYNPYYISNIYQNVAYQTAPLRASVLLLSNEAYLTGQVTVRGYVQFTQAAAGAPVTVTGYINNLSPGLHGFHVHELGRLDNACASTGGHFNPYNCNHGSPTSRVRHVGDLGNILSNATGRAEISITDRQISLTGVNSIIGRAVVVNSGQDDLGLGGKSDSLTTGAAGSPLACGIIGLM